MKQKILIIGGSGMLGSRLVNILSKDFQVENPTSRELNVFNKKELKKRISKIDYNSVIYAAGLTNQELCENEKDIAKYLNSEAVKIIAKEVKNNGVKLIYFSTDAVFNGKEKISYKENDKKSPVNYYGLTKSMGEDNVLAESSSNLVIRLASLYSHNYSKKIDFARKSLLLLSEGKNCIGISDQYFNPAYTDFAAKIVRKTFDKKISGILHIGTRDVISNLDFIKLLAKKFGYNKSLITPVNFRDFFKSSSFPRGQNQILDVTKALNLFGTSIVTNAKNILDFKENYSE